jgi:hypothetical protein
MGIEVKQEMREDNAETRRGGREKQIGAELRQACFFAEKRRRT